MPVLCQGRGVTLPESGSRLCSRLVRLWTPERPRLRVRGGRPERRMALQNASVWQKARLARERSEPDAVVLDHRELTGPLRAAREGSDSNSNGVSGEVSVIRKSTIPTDAARINR